MVTSNALWKTSFIRGFVSLQTTLASTSQMRLIDYRLYQDQCSKPQTAVPGNILRFQAPTWSWASVNQKVGYWASLAERDFRVSVERASCTPVRDGDWFGQIKDGYIVVKANLCPARVLWKQADDAFGLQPQPSHGLSVHGENVLVYPDYAWARPGKDQLRDIEQVYCLGQLESARLGDSVIVSLVIRPLDGGKKYERVGLCLYSSYRDEDKICNPIPRGPHSLWSEKKEIMIPLADSHRLHAQLVKRVRDIKPQNARMATQKAAERGAMRMAQGTILELIWENRRLVEVNGEAVRGFERMVRENAALRAEEVRVVEGLAEKVRVVEGLAEMDREYGTLRETCGGGGGVGSDGGGDAGGTGGVGEAGEAGGDWGWA
ncbi:hypothetical protein BU16DRAFT_567369 [Lophium mytilinum]|uniref:Uncharacterized protein n=1 Tax=Lophium mytilinum TaxID=390894 RepID=A0A6A6Q9U2_9PEZI|nr:hypothetical protein BU16DRAFT_567369 [Lophium mytilinum]